MIFILVREVESAISRPRPQLKANRPTSSAEDLGARCDVARARGQARALTGLGNLKERLHELRESFERKADMTRLKAKWAALGHHYEGLVAQLPKASIKIPRPEIKSLEAKLRA